MAALKKLPSDCVAPLRLKAISLHGIGSYLQPARLEIRPLTILCGTNRFVGSARPVDMSAGFHQIAPILVQMGVMRMNELLAVENPEVHLHPKLQLSFMECLIEHAMIGKFLLIETHSDLMVRRTMRALAEADLPQSWVNIYFSDIEKVADTHNTWTSSIERLRIEKGRIVNWPEGFLDDDEKESLSLIRAMYGTPTDGGEDE